MQRGLTYLLIIFGLLPFQISPKFFSLYRAPWLKGWADHTSSTVKSELLLIIEYTTYMIVTCTQSPLMSLLDSWNWCFFLSPWILKIFEEDIWFRLPNHRVASFILSFLSLPLLCTCTCVYIIKRFWKLADRYKCPQPIGEIFPLHPYPSVVGGW
jgi:hypothetical protein